MVCGVVVTVLQHMIVVPVCGCCCIVWWGYYITVMWPLLQATKRWASTGKQPPTHEWSSWSRNWRQVSCPARLEFCAVSKFFTAILGAGTGCRLLLLFYLLLCQPPHLNRHCSFAFSSKNFNHPTRGNFVCVCDVCVCVCAHACWCDLVHVTCECACVWLKCESSNVVVVRWLEFLRVALGMCRWFTSCCCVGGWCLSGSLIMLFIADAHAVRLDDYDVHEVANALKRFLRELEDSLFMRERYNEWVRTSGQWSCCLMTVQ